MGAKMRVSEWGRSLAVRIPKAIAQQWGVSEGSAVEMETVGDEVVLRRRTYNLSDMLSRVKVENLHREQDVGESQCKEQW